MADVTTAPPAPAAQNSAPSASAGTQVAPPVVTSANPAVPPAGGATTGNNSPWFASFKNEEVKSYLQTKGFADAEVLADSYKGLEKLLGAPKEQIVRLPTDPNAPEWADVYAKLGTPKDINGYKIDPVKDQAGSAEFVSWAKETFLDAKLTPDQANKVMAKWNDLQKNAATKQTEAQAAQLKANGDALKTEWGNAYEQNIKIAEHGAKGFGLDKDKLNKIQNALGYSETIKLFKDIGSKMGEATFTEGVNMGSGYTTPEIAKAQLEAYKADTAFMQAYARGSAKEKGIMNKLFADAYPGTNII